MDFCRKIGDDRWSLSQGEDLQVIIKKGNDIISAENYNYKLDSSKAFAILSKAPNMKPRKIETKRNEIKLNIETVEKKVIKEEKREVPKPHMCVFCGAVPKVVSLISANGTGDNETRALTCMCKGKDAAYARWIYTVDVVNNNRDEADIKLISEWNRRMPVINK